jgi:hypothetical protein
MLDPEFEIPGLVLSIASFSTHRTATPNRHFGCGTIRMYGFGDFQPCG